LQTITLKDNRNNAAIFDGSRKGAAFTLGNAYNDDPSVWYLIYNGDDISLVTHMKLAFSNGKVFDWYPGDDFSTFDGEKHGWVVKTPYTWEIVAGNSFLVTAESGEVIFSISGYHNGSPNKGISIIKRIVDEQFNPVTNKIGPFAFIVTVEGEGLNPINITTDDEGWQSGVWRGAFKFEDYDELDSLDFSTFTGTITITESIPESVPDGWEYDEISEFEFTYKDGKLTDQHANTDWYSGIDYRDIYKYNYFYISYEQWVSEHGGVNLYTKFSDGHIWDAFKTGTGTNAEGQYNEIQNIYARTSASGDYKSYLSFCAHVGSWSYSGEYDINYRLDAVARAEILSAFNYIYDTFGSLDGWAEGANYSKGIVDPADATRVLAQMAVWYFVPPDANKFNIVEIYPKDARYAEVKLAFDDVKKAVAERYKGKGKIIDIVYLSSAANPSDVGNGQPQIIPIIVDIQSVDYKFPEEAEALFANKYLLIEEGGGEEVVITTETLIAPPRGPRTTTSAKETTATNDSVNPVLIADYETPLAKLPDNDIVFFDDDVPLGDIPQTGVGSEAFSLAMLGLSLMSLLAVAVASGRKKS